MKQQRSCLGWLVVIAAVAGCLPQDLVAAEPIIPYTQEAQLRGLLYVMQDYPQAAGNDGFGCGFADLDADGDPDIVLLGATDNHVGIFKNDGTGHFTDMSAGSGIPLLPEAAGFVTGDYDGDGDLDLYITQSALANVLLRNEGNFQFTEVGAAAGVADVGSGQSASFGDYDGDGWLDLYLCNYTGLADPPPGIRNKLYHNLGTGVFEDVSVAQTVDDPGYGFQSVWFDYDRDGDVDLYLSNDRGHLPPLFQHNQLWRNDGGQLVNVSEGSGADLGFFSMGVACGDFDGNGWPDLYCTNLPGGPPDGRNPLFLNQGDGTFIESSLEAGVGQVISSWGAMFFDFDNNGHMELYVNNQFVANALFKHDGVFPCTNIAAAAGVTGNTGNCTVPPTCNSSFSSAIADVDGDGDLDLLLNNLDINVELFINHEGEQNNWIRYRVRGEGANRFAVGASIDTRIGDTWHFREVLAGGNGYKGQDELVVHVGLGEAEVADEIVVSWPGGKVTRTLTNLPANYTWTICPPDLLGDANEDGQVAAEDYTVFVNCFGAPFVPGCEIKDFDGDSDVDCDDWELFLDAWDGPGDPPSLPPCDCPAELTGDGVVGSADLAVLLGNWGPYTGPADLNGDGVVGSADLAILLGNWGPCP